MLIENQDALKTWLSSILGPLCDADPAALAKYVIALVKKDKPEVELRESMIEQLEVFLQNETTGFVNLLFRTLESKVYLSKAEETPSAVPTPLPHLPLNLPLVVPTATSSVTNHSSAPSSAAIVQPPPSLSPPPLTLSTPPPLPLVLSAAGVGVVGVANGGISGRRDEVAVGRSQRKSDTEKDDKDHRVRRKSRSPHRVRSRSRSRSWEQRPRRSRSREMRERGAGAAASIGRDRDRDRGGGSGSERGKGSSWEERRRKSPGLSRRYERENRERRRSWSHSRSPGRNHSMSPPARSRSPRHRSRNYHSRSRSQSARSRSRSPRSGRSRSRSTSRTPHERSRTRSKSGERRDGKREPKSGSGTPTQDSNHGDVDMRLTNRAQSILSVVNSTAVTDNSSNLYHQAHKKQRCRDYDEKGYCMRGDLCPFDHGADPVVLEDVSLPQMLDFPPGGAMGPQQGPPMGYVPGPPPQLMGPNRGPPSATGAGSAAGPPPPPGALLRRQEPKGGPPPPPPPGTGMEPYNPDAPSMEPRLGWRRPPFRGQGPVARGGPMGPRHMGQRGTMYPGHQRELINVPVTEDVQNHGLKRRTGENYNPMPRDTDAPRKKPCFDYSRLGPRKVDPTNCSLELRKVPRGLNNISLLNSHFEKFGKIINIQVCYDGDLEAALITFSNHAEANAAYRSTEAVLNNRFIKVFWHNKENQDAKQENNVSPSMKPSVKDRLGFPSKVLNTVQPKASPIDNEKVIMSGNNLTKTVYNPAALKKQENAVKSDTSKAQAVAAVKKNQEFLAAKEALKKKQEEKKKEAIKLKLDLRKRKQDMVKEQLQQQKKLIEKLEKNRSGMKPEERNKIIELIKSLQESIEVIQKELSAVTSSQQSTSKKTKEEAQKEILDAELDLYNKQQEGGDTFELQKKVAELKMEAQALGLIGNSTRGAHVRGRGRGRGSRGTSFRGRQRGGFVGSHTSVDRRPTRVMVSGFESDEKQEVLAHFAQFGEVVDYILEESIPSIVLNFKSRKEAELALSRGRCFNDRTLTMAWYLEPVGLVSRGMKTTLTSMSSVANAASTKSDGQDGRGATATKVEEDGGRDEVEDEIGYGYVNEDELQDDEEEEEDGEDRSWRR